MSTIYSQKQSLAQKKDASSASSVLDNSSQSESLQRKANMANNAAQREESPRPNNTGMPDNLKSGIESLSGFSMDDVRVHYNSSKPATVQALAYTQGTDIHVAPDQEKHLPHEAWHVAQQMAGRVSPTTNINGMPVNDNAALEHEADVMGAKAVQCKQKRFEKKQVVSLSNSSIQRFKYEQRGRNLVLLHPNVVGSGEKSLDLRDSANRTIFKTLIDKITSTLFKSFPASNYSDFREGESMNVIEVPGQQPKPLPIDIHDIVDDCKDKEGLTPEKFNEGLTSADRALGGDACVIQALVSLEIFVPNDKSKSERDHVKSWHNYCRMNNINYKNDTGSYILYKMMQVINGKKIDLIGSNLNVLNTFQEKGDGSYLVSVNEHMFAVVYHKKNKKESYEIKDMQEQVEILDESMVAKFIYKVG